MLIMRLQLFGGRGSGSGNKGGGSGPATTTGPNGTYTAGDLVGRAIKADNMTAYERSPDFAREAYWFFGQKRVKNVSDGARIRISSPNGYTCTAEIKSGCKTDTTVTWDGKASKECNKK
jgi:hypothetical protein